MASPISTWEQLMKGANPIAPATTFDVDPVTGQIMFQARPPTPEEEALAGVNSPTVPPSQETKKTLLPPNDIQAGPIDLPTDDLKQERSDQRGLEQAQRAIDQSRLNVSTLMGEQNLGLKNLNQLAQNIRSAPQEISWKPLAGLLDNLYGSKISGIVPEVETPTQRQEKLVKIQELIQQRQGDVAKNALEQLKAELGNKQLLGNQAALKGAQSAERLQLNKEKNLTSDVYKDITHPAQEDAKTLGVLDSALSSGSYAQLRTVLSQYARVIAGEKGVLTDQDVTRQLPSNFKGDIAKFVSYMSDTPDSEIPPEYTKIMKNMVQTAKDKLADKYENLLKSKEQTYGAPKSVYRDIMVEGGAGHAALKSARDAISGFKAKPSVSGGAAPIDPIAAAKAEAAKRGL